MSMNKCPICHKELTWEGPHYLCGECARHFKKVAFCPTCDNELEKLQACGSVSYFCPTCNELKSKSTVRIEMQIIPNTP
ncbi:MULTISPECIES: zinc ribbon domain-containing protein [Vibrio]|uniref:DNA ligase n=2 Tax=Vibrio TaxID=662 RepID=A0A7X4RUY4_9VIBR|nr:MULTISPECIES: zinc ribbon domain-containing protein [Vibrio]MBF8999126.1 zinc ribbon domain-containing protein [Vibrio nitrifigilis]MZI94341.1 DNA ligase [Vibrio eleionomae]